MTKMHNPVNFLSLLPLFPAEKEFVRCLAAGKSCEVGNGKLPQNGIKSGEGANVVRGEVIRFFAYGGDKEHFVRGTIIKLQGAWICGKDSMDLKYVRVPYALQFIDCHFTVGVEMRYARCAALHLCGSRFKQKLHANWLTTKGAVRLSDGFSAEDGVQLLGANIGGDFSCTKGEFRKSGEGKYALDVAGMTTKGSVLLNKGFFAKGEVRLLGASIAGKLDCAGGCFNNMDEQGRKYALNAEQVKTGGHVYLNKHKLSGGDRPFSARGRVRFANADVGRNFNCKGGQFYQPGKKSAIAAAGLRTRGAVFLSDRFSVDGNVDLNVAQIGGNFVCKICKKSDPVASIIDLSATKAAAVDDDPESWKPFKFILDGFTYDTFYGDSPTGSRSRLKWLKRRPTKRLLKNVGMVDFPFSPLPYEQAAKVLFGMGRASDAREILLKKERLQTKDGKMPWLQRVGRRLWDVFAGYGYRLSYTAVWMAVFVAIGMVVFDAADARRRIVPAQVIVQANSDYGHGVESHGARPTDVVPEIFPGYTEFTPLAYSLDVFIPFFILQQESAWLPDSGDTNNVWKPSIMLALAILVLAILAFSAEWIERRCEGPRGRACAYAGMLGVIFAICCYFSNWLFCDWWWLTVWYWLEIGAGWILTSLFLLSVTGLLRPRQSSGERD